MAKTFSVLSSLLLIFSTLISASRSQYYSENLSPSSLGLKNETLTHLHFYFHDIITGEHPTTFQITQAATTNTSSTAFGAVWMMDDPLTLQPEPTSKLVGRAQGFYASASQNEIGFLMVLNFVFSEGKYNGSTLSILGRNTIFSTVREMPVVGGSGVFRFARGYAQARTHTIDIKARNAIVEYNVYVFHY